MKQERVHNSGFDMKIKPLFSVFSESLVKCTPLKGYGGIKEELSCPFFIPTTFSLNPSYWNIIA